MKSLKFYPTNINRRYIDETVSALRDGKLIIYPTDTLYAIGCDALNNRAIEKICRIKGINPAKQLLSIVCSDISQAAEYARIDNNAFRLMRSNLPGPFTFILPAATTLPKAFKGRHTVGVRIPDNDIARAIADALGNPLLSTSVSIDRLEGYETVEPLSLAIQYEDTVDLLVDGGTGSTGQSTIVDCLDSSYPEITREGTGTLRQ
ncbi:MAG: L-threonylcarbamoyladenylate synthase [Muribaculaceae bacterium]|jgi:tRNA threonylcarbamoyl adenosine modification protein (Sua5/YciO/YrdC/YwlC family)|nr:L-threonylcarbamoyladenylate synthase [Muribaculaceae bacterium]